MTGSDTLHTFDSGAKSSPAPRYDLVPRILLDAVERRFALGAEKYGERQWEAGLRDPKFLRERANHALTHLLNYIHGTDNGEDSPMDNLAAVGWGVAVLLRAEQVKADGPKPGGIVPMTEQELKANYREAWSKNYARLR